MVQSANPSAGRDDKERIEAIVRYLCKRWGVRDDEAHLQEDVRDLVRLAVKRNWDMENVLRGFVVSREPSPVTGEIEPRVLMRGWFAVDLFVKAGGVVKPEEIYEEGRFVGVSVYVKYGDSETRASFTLGDAERAGLGGPFWRAFPQDMCFWRAVLRAIRRVNPGVLGGFYTVEEFNGGGGNGGSSVSGGGSASSGPSKVGRLRRV